MQNCVLLSMSGLFLVLYGFSIRSDWVVRDTWNLLLILAWELGNAGRDNSVQKLLPQLYPQRTLKVQYLTPMTLSPELNKSLAKALGKPISSSRTSRASCTAWVDHGLNISLTFLFMITLLYIRGLPTSTAVRRVYHSFGGCEVSVITRYRLCACFALNKGTLCENFSQQAALSNDTAIGLIRNDVHKNQPATGSCKQQQRGSRLRVILPTYSPSFHDFLLKDGLN